MLDVLTYLGPDYLRQGPDELRRSVDAEFHGLLIYYLPDGEPEHGFQSLAMVSAPSFQRVHGNIPPQGRPPHFAPWCNVLT